MQDVHSLTFYFLHLEMFDYIQFTNRNDKVFKNQMTLQNYSGQRGPIKNAHICYEAFNWFLPTVATVVRKLTKGLMV